MVLRSSRAVENRNPQVQGSACCSVQVLMVGLLLQQLSFCFKIGTVQPIRGLGKGLPTRLQGATSIPPAVSGQGTGLACAGAALPALLRARLPSWAG